MSKIHDLYIDAIKKFGEKIGTAWKEMNQEMIDIEKLNSHKEKGASSTSDQSAPKKYKGVGRGLGKNWVKSSEFLKKNHGWVTRSVLIDIAKAILCDEKNVARQIGGYRGHWFFNKKEIIPFLLNSSKFGDMFPINKNLLLKHIEENEKR